MEHSNTFKSVLILLSTYNGEKYLIEQLESLYRQQGVNINIIVRDDGSSDSTIKILSEYSSRFLNMTILAEDNIGCESSFNRLISYANSKMSKFDYYAFCDQDDVWDEDKLFCAVNNLGKFIENPFRLYTSAYRVVDEKLIFQYNQVFTYRHTLGEALIMNNAIGCTMVFTKSLLEQAEKRINFDEPNKIWMPNHDGLIYMTAIALSAYIYYDATPYIYYRQHGNNLVGAYKASFKNRLKRILANKNVKSKMAIFLLNMYDNIDADSKQLLTLNATYQNSIRSKLKLIFSKEMMTNKISLNLAYRVLIIFNWF